MQAIVDEILRREGWPAFTDHPADKGGATKGGITLEAWREYSKRPAATAAELAAITEDQARRFYELRHIIEPRFDQIADPMLRELVVDAGVNHGVPMAVKWLQAAAGVEVDGRIGPRTLAAVNAAHAAALFARVLAYRLRLYGRLVSKDQKLAQAVAAGFRLQAENAAGWNNRSAELLDRFARKLEQGHTARRP